MSEQLLPPVNPEQANAEHILPAENLQLAFIDYVKDIHKTLTIEQVTEHFYDPTPLNKAHLAESCYAGTAMQVARENIHNSIAQPQADTSATDLFHLIQLSFTGYIGTALSETYGKPVLFRQQFIRSINSAITTRPDLAFDLASHLNNYTEYLRDLEPLKSRIWQNKTFNHMSGGTQGHPHMVWISLVHSALKTENGTSYTQMETMEQHGKSDTSSFWFKICQNLRDKDASKPQELDRHYIAERGVDYKDPEILLDILIRLETEPAGKVIGANVKKYGDRWALDIYMRQLKEAENLGYVNAGKLVKLFDSIPKREMAPFSTIIYAANLLTDSLNQALNLDEHETKLKRLRPVDITNVPEALNRLQYTVFELGSRPEDHDPLSFLINGEILGLLASNATERMDASSKPTGESAQEKQARIYRDISKHRRGSHTYWNRWKAGYGILR
jgi:hypothetical protein